MVSVSFVHNRESFVEQFTCRPALLVGTRWKTFGTRGISERGVSVVWDKVSLVGAIGAVYVV
jgi:hypothetical protein